jgi:hypothetical protein
MSTIQKADTRKSTNLLKKYLRERFNIEVSVKSEYYSMGSSLNISYNLGIDEKEVESIVKNLQYSRFDGMTDCSYNVDNAGIIIDGYQLAEFKHVFVKQDWSEDFSYKLAKFLSDNIKFQDVPELESKEQMHTLAFLNCMAAPGLGANYFGSFSKLPILPHKTKAKLIF